MIRSLSIFLAIALLLFSNREAHSRRMSEECIFFYGRDNIVRLYGEKHVSDFERGCQDAADGMVSAEGQSSAYYEGWYYYFQVQGYE